MSNIRVRIRNPEAIRARLKPQQGVQVGEDKLYLFDADLILDSVEDARDWAIKTDGLVDAEDYSSKAWAIGGTGTETNNSKYYASQAATSAGNAYTSETNAAASASTATTQAGIATAQAGIATTKAGEAATSASTATTQAGIATTQAGIATTKAGEASTSATNAYNSASQASTSATNAYNSAGQAATSATSASNSADQSKQWAIGVPTEPADGSAKYWASQAQSAVESIGDATLTIQKNGSDLGTFTANATVDKTIDIPIPTTASDVSALPDSTKYGAGLSLTINSTNYVMTAQLKDQDGNNLGTAQTIDLPLESVVVSGSYDSVNKKIVLTLKNGTTIDIPIGDLISGLQTEITENNKLDADLVDDSTSANKFVTASDITTWNGKQDTISDLSTIRTNASNGASAYTTIQSYGDIVTHNASEFATSAQGELADTALQSGDNVSELINDSGYITGITSSDVTTALGYTPYNATNPNGYITSSALTPYVLASSLATVATSGSYNDLSDKPTIPSAQVNSDWNANSGVAEILNKPMLGTMAAESASDYTPTANLATVATSGDYDDLSNKPTIPTVNNSTITLTQGGVTKGSFTLNQSSGATIDFDASSGAPSFATITGQPTDNANLATALNAKYDASNPDGYQANVIETVKVNGTALTPVSKAVDVTVPTKTSDLTNDDGFITGITSSDVTTALGYTPADDSGVVDLTSDQSISGLKTFTDDLVRESSDISNTAGGYIINNTELDTTTAPTSATYHYLRCHDKNGKILGDIRFVRGTDGSQTTQIMARSAISGSEVSAVFGVVSGADGTDSVNGSKTVLRSIGNLIMPSTTAYSTVTVKSSGSSYTAPNTGYIFVSLSRSAASWVLAISANGMLAKGTTSANNNTNTVTAWLPVKKGDSYTVTYSGQSSISIRFISAVLEE